ncbi:L,D-transpeptidase [Planomonospora sp. ID67723]|uniref:L,D-transpeptidase n=1 Tax=Planomonospora sp. ID67723 TaxID=2738134 RepID=UPI0018C3AAF9|nr:Ig-like domain-containing protein [Planomonospora sp. ID67723]MBG0829339.1 L,D-transpeptidase [Planomonospora sp. ID67723]
MRQAIRGSTYAPGLLALALMGVGPTANAAAVQESAPPSQRAGAAPGAVRAAASVTVTPADGTGGVPTDTTVLVGVQDGTLKKVTVKGPKGSLPGVMSADGTQWRSQGQAAPGTSYEVTAVAVNPDGETTESVTSFSTVRPAGTFSIASLMPDRDYTGLTVGVGMPIMITFDRDVSDRVSVERNLLVRTSKPVLGAWHWFDDRTVHFRPRTFWPAGTKVRLEARLSGVRGGNGLYGKADRVLDFRIGRSQITEGSIHTHQLTVRRGGEEIRRIPMSAGQGGQWKYHTTSGVHLAMSREPVTVMTSPGIGPGQPGYYRMTVYNTVRISNSGEYVHSAPWSVGSQGSANVSHGCVNVSPAHARWFIDNTLIGDPIIITGSPRRLEPLNGWGHWQETWGQWIRWSSTKSFTTEAVGSA